MPKPNPARSGGPKTAAGRAIASRNALTHGAYAALVVLPGEDAAAFEGLAQGLQGDFNPRNSVEAALVRDVGVLLWKKWRIDKAAHAVMAARMSQPLTSLDISKLFEGERLPEGLEIYAEAALNLTVRQVDELRELALQVDNFQKLSNPRITSQELQQNYGELHRRVVAMAEQRAMDVSELLGSRCFSTFGRSEWFQQELIAIEVGCRCSLWVWERRELVQLKLAQAKEGRILELMQDAGASRASDDLNRALYRTLSELRKLQDWRLHVGVTDVTPKT